MKKRLIGILTIISMLFCMIPTTAFADSGTIDVSNEAELSAALNKFSVINRAVSIRLTNDIKVKNTINIYGNGRYYYYVDLNGYTIEKSDTTQLFSVGTVNSEQPSTLRIVNNSTKKTGRIIKASHVKSGRFLYISKCGHTIIGGGLGEIEIADFNGYTVLLNYGSEDLSNDLTPSLDIKSGVTIKNCSGKIYSGAAIHAEKYSTVNLYGGSKITDCNSDGYGGAVGVEDNAVLNMYDGFTVENCVSNRIHDTKKSEGGGVYVASGGTFNMYGGTITGCSAQGQNGRGGGVYVATGGTFNLKGGIITNNSAYFGGGISMWGGISQLSNGEIKNNTASQHGNEIAMLDNENDGTVNGEICGTKITHEENTGGCSTNIFVDGQNSTLKITSGEVNIKGVNYGFAGSGNTIISGGYIRAAGKIKAFNSTPTVTGMDVAAGLENAEKVIKSFSQSDLEKQSVIMADKGELIVTVTFENPNMYGLAPDKTPSSVQLLKGMCLSQLPVVSDKNNTYVFNGWQNISESGSKYWSLSDPVMQDTVLTSCWSNFNMSTSKGEINLTETYGYLFAKSDGVTFRNNGGVNISFKYPSETKYFNISQFYYGDYKGYIEKNDQITFYVEPKADLEAGSYSENLEIEVSASELGYSSIYSIPVTLVVEKATPVISNTFVFDMYYGQSLKDAVKNSGKAALISNTVFKKYVDCDVEFFEPENTLPIGNSQEVDATFIPTDTKNFNTFTGKAYVNVHKMPINMLTADLKTVEITYGTKLKDIDLNSGWKWVDESIMPVPNNSGYEAYFEIDDVNNYDFTNTDAARYDSANKRIVKTVSVNVNKAIPDISMPTASDIYTGQTLSQSILTDGKATAEIDGVQTEINGAFIWEEPNTIVQEGEHYYPILFVPDNTELYETVSAGNIKVTANTLITITLCPDNNENDITQTIIGSGKITEPKNITKSGYILDGWYLDDKKWDFENDIATNDITLKAKWTDIEKPTGEIKIAENKWYVFLNKITFDLFFNETQTVTLSGNDNSGNVHIQYYVGNEDLTVEQLSQLSFTPYTDSFKLKQDGKYIVYAKLYDDSQNVTYLRSDGVTIDSIMPVISGIENGKTYCGNQSFTVTEENLHGVYIDNSPIYPTGNNEYIITAKDNAQTISIYDKAGNITQISVTINSNHTYQWQTDNGEYWKKCTVCGAETPKNIIPVLNIDGADKVCRTQDYNFSVAIDETMTDITTGYDFSYSGDSYPNTAVDGICRDTISCVNYVENENRFKVTVSAKTTDGYIVKSEKNVTIIDNHEGGTAYCTSKAICEICGEQYGNIDENHHSGLIHVSAKESSEKTEGNIEYWYCADCDKYYKDENCMNLIDKTDTVTAKLTKQQPNNETDKNRKDEPKKAQTTIVNNNKKSPETGEYNSTATLVVLGAGLLAIRKRKDD